MHIHSLTVSRPLLSPAFQLKANALAIAAVLRAVSEPQMDKSIFLGVSGPQPGVTAGSAAVMTLQSSVGCRPDRRPSRFRAPVLEGPLW